MAKRLEAAEAELKIWREGGTVSETDRVELSETLAGTITQEALKDEAEQDDDSPQDSAAQEAAVKELLEREEELLNLLDVKVRNYEHDSIQTIFSFAVLLLLLLLLLAINRHANTVPVGTLIERVFFLYATGILMKRLCMCSLLNCVYSHSLKTKSPPQKKKKDYH